jgi:prephenate dehydrogenase
MINIGVIGLGLIGGSFALAAKKTLCRCCTFWWG